MLLVTLIRDPLSPDEATHHEVEPRGLVGFLAEQFPEWPETARIYKGSVAVENDVTPRDEAGVAELEQAEAGSYVVVTYPGDPITAIIAVVATLALTAITLLFLMPKLPGAGSDIESANNSLGNRSNKPRPNERIPDIFGRVVSYPEMLTYPIVTFEDDVEVEVAFMCVGRGSYDIERVRDGGTPISLIAGAGAEFYGPMTSPNSGSPQLTVGAPVEAPFREVIRLNEVNGQKLDPPNANNLSGNGNIRFVAPNYIENDGSYDFRDFFGPGDDITVTSAGFESSPVTQYQNADAYFDPSQIAYFNTLDPTTVFSIGQTVTLMNAVYSDGSVTVDLSGSYEVGGFLGGVGMQLTDIPTLPSSGDWPQIATIPEGETYSKSVTFSWTSTAGGGNYNGTYPASDVSATVITLAEPETVNSAWADLEGETEWASPSLSTSGQAWVGPFVVDMIADTIVVNITAPQGMYRVTKKGKDTPWSASVLAEVTPVDVSGNPTGAATTYAATISGDGKDKAPKGKTMEIALPAPGRYRIRMRRTTPKNLNTEDTIVDELKWRDCYGTRVISDAHFGDVTTVFSRTYATSQATGQRDRKLSCVATRKVLQKNVDGTFGPALVASRNAADIICHMALDPYIGGRQLSELDVPQIYSTIGEVQDYFEVDEAGEFNYTFDQSNISFEEMVQTVAQAVFCTAYRQGSKLRLYFERETNDAAMLFNHRNKIPGSETRTVRFGTLEDHDGVELVYASPEDGAKLTLYRPADRSAVKAKKLEVLGVRDERVANLHIDRAWNKIRYQNVTAQFEGLAEATQLVLGELIFNADNTRDDVFDGEVLAQSGLTLTLSQPVVPSAGATYTIFLLRPDGGVDSIPIVTPTSETRSVTLTAPPTFSLKLDADDAVPTLFQVVSSEDVSPRAFILTEKGAYAKRSLTLTAINYDSRYYQGDGAYRV